MTQTKTSGSRPVVLLVDDNPDTRALVLTGARLYRPPFDIEFAQSAAEACEMLSRKCYSALVLDVNLLGPTGVTVAAEAHEKCPDMPKVFFTAYDRSVTHEHAAEFGMETWAKPMDAKELFGRIEQLIASRPAGPGEGAASPLEVPVVLSAIAGALLSAGS
ncbi:MAG TPA: response regulator [Pyrinomonadaceae bacterium]